MSGAPGQRLRIGLISPPWFTVPPTGYGGIEWVVSLLAEGLVARGHEVTLFAAGGSQTSARLLSLYSEAPSALLGDIQVEYRHLLDAYAHWREFDIIHDHTLTGLLAGSFLPLPVVHTIHGPINEQLGQLYKELSQHVRLVAVSQHQHSTLPEGCEAAVIYNGTDVTRFPFREKPGSYLLFVGRMAPEKGILDALEIVRRAGKPLKILAKINEQPEREYFEAYVRPAMAGLEIDFHEQVTHDVKAEAFAGALATIFPIRWPEPFGLVMTESMVTGTPVIAYRNGSVPEVIAGGETGFICDTMDEAVEAVGKVHSLDRRACRRRVEEHFSAALNVARHEALYQRLVADGAAKWASPRFKQPAGG